MAKEAAVMELIWDLVRGRTDDISKVTYFPQKPVFPGDVPYEQPFQRVTPESQGISSVQVEGLLRALGTTENLYMHNVMILRNGKVIGETSFYPYSGELWHMGYSMSKSVVSMGIGFLIQEEKLSLNTKVVDIFRKNVSLLGMIRQKDVTVEHLLTMTSGVSLNETGAVTGNDWVKSFLESSVHSDPGTAFEYNSMNSYMLSAIVTEVTGESLESYLKPRLFEPLGITRVFWEKCPKGNSKGGWGLFLCIEDMAKLGQLYLDKGCWKGVQILPEAWVEASVISRVIPPEDTGFVGYGYQIWNGRREESFAFNGMLGQNVFVYPDLKMVVATTAGNEVFFNGHELQRILEIYLPPKGSDLSPLPENKEAYGKLLRVQREFSAPPSSFPAIQKGGWGRKAKKEKNWQQEGEKLSGRHYALETSQVGLMPLLGQVFHNNYTKGIRELGFRMEKRQFYLEVLEGECLNSIPVGFREESVFDLNLNGEPYRLAAKGIFGRDEEGRLVLTVTLSFLEEAFKRKIRILFEKDRIQVRFSEIPGKNVIMDGLSSVTETLLENPILKKIQEKGNVDLIRLVIENTLEPTVSGYPM